jgi:hypothetical protein
VYGGEPADSLGSEWFMRMNAGMGWRSLPGEEENTFRSAGAITARASTRFHSESHGTMAEQPTERLDLVDSMRRMTPIRRSWNA